MADQEYEYDDYGDYDDDGDYDDVVDYGVEDAAPSAPAGGTATSTSTTVAGLSRREARTMTFQETLSMQSAVVDAVAALTCLSASAAALLLDNFRWSQGNALETYFGNNERELAKLSLTQESATHTNTLCPGAPSTQTMCDICCMEYAPHEVLCLSSCRHYFCKECWQDHIKQHIHHNLLSTRCPAQKCRELVGIRNMVQLFDAGDGSKGSAAACSPVLRDIYREYLASFVQCCPTLYWCPNPVGCTGIIHVEVPPLQGQGVACEVCHHPYCLRCSGDPHRPATCHNMSLWRQYCSAEGANIAFILVRTKRCPKCQRDIEKNGGCNHMTCKCGYQFCWVCGHDWTSHSGDFYSCKNAAEAPLKEEGNDVRQSERFLYHYERYTLHIDSAARDVTFIDTYTMNTYASDSAEVIKGSGGGSAPSSTAPDASGHATNVITLIKNTLQAARLVIAHAYVQMFYQDDSTADAMMLAHRSGKLEEATEQLSGRVVEYLRLNKQDVGPMLDLVHVVNRWQTILCEA